MLSKFYVVVRGKLNFYFLNPFGVSYFVFSRFFLNRNIVRFIPKVILVKTIKSLKRLGNVKDAERIVINLYSDSENKKEGFLFLLKIKSPIKALSIVKERCPNVFFEKYGFETTYLFSLCLLKSGKLDLAMRFFDQLHSEMPNNILVVRRLSWLYYHSRKFDMAYKLMLSVKNHKKITPIDQLFIERCGRECSSFDVLSMLKVKYGI